MTQFPTLWTCSVAWSLIAMRCWNPGKWTSIMKNGYIFDFKTSGTQSVCTCFYQFSQACGFLPYPTPITRISHYLWSSPKEKVQRDQLWPLSHTVPRREGVCSTDTPKIQDGQTCHHVSNCSLYIVPRRRAVLLAVPSLLELWLHHVWGLLSRLLLQEVSELKNPPYIFQKRGDPLKKAGCRTQWMCKQV